MSSQSNTAAPKSGHDIPQDDSRRITIYPDLISGIVFLLLGLVLLVILPGQVAVAQNDVVNGRVFPRLLIVLMIVCSAILIVKDLVKLKRKQPVNVKVIDFGVECRAAIIFAILLATYAICRVTNLFIAGACFCCVAFLLFFGCRKKLYYGITLAVAAAVWASFRFILNVNF